MWVVKLGGSLARSAALADWLRLAAEVGGGRVVVVPGGGHFADAVREAQAHWAFDDLAAHNMAVLAMAQTALMLQAVEPRLVPARHDVAIREAVRAGRSPVWLPLELLRQVPDELTSWEVTSDSLALWLARRLHAERLVVVKACAVEPSRTLAELGAAGVLDARFADWAREAAFPIEVVHCDRIGQVRARLLADGA